MYIQALYKLEVVQYNNKSHISIVTISKNYVLMVARKTDTIGMRS
jgi:hypothetical protein